jgi:hypothetical protein
MVLAAARTESNRATGRLAVILHQLVERGHPVRAAVAICIDHYKPDASQLDSRHGERELVPP